MPQVVANIFCNNNIIIIIIYCSSQQRLVLRVRAVRCQFYMLEMRWQEEKNIQSKHQREQSRLEGEVSQLKAMISVLQEKTSYEKTERESSKQRKTYIAEKVLDRTSQHDVSEKMRSCGGMQIGWVLRSSWVKVSERWSGMQPIQNLSTNVASSARRCWDGGVNSALARNEHVVIRLKVAGVKNSGSAAGD